MSARNRKKGGRHSFSITAKTLSPCRRGDVSTNETKGRLRRTGLLGCRLFVLGCHLILQKKRKLINTEQQRNPKRLSTRVSLQNNPTHTWARQSQARNNKSPNRNLIGEGKANKTEALKTWLLNWRRQKDRPTTLTYAHCGQKQIRQRDT